MDINEKEDSVIIACGRSIDVTNVSLCRQILQKALDLNKKILLQADEIERIDSAGIQLFISFWLTAQQFGVSCKWESTSRLFLYIAHLIGAEEFLELKDNDYEASE